MTCPVRFPPRGQPTNLPPWRLLTARSRTWLGSEPGRVCVCRSVCRPAQGAPRYDIVLLLSSRHFKAICIFDGPQPFSSLSPRKILLSPPFPPQSSFSLSRHFFRPVRHRRGGLSLSRSRSLCAWACTGRTIQKRLGAKCTLYARTAVPFSGFSHLFCKGFSMFTGCWCFVPTPLFPISPTRTLSLRFAHIRQKKQYFPPKK